MRNRTTDIGFPVFNGYVVRVIVSRNMKATGRRLHADLADCVAAFVSDTGQPKCGWLVLQPDADAGTIAHESSHAIRVLFTTHGVRMDDETFAYHLDYLVGRIHKFLKGQR